MSARCTLAFGGNMDIEAKVKEIKPLMSAEDIRSHLSDKFIANELTPEQLLALQDDVYRDLVATLQCSGWSSVYSNYRDFAEEKVLAVWKVMMEAKSASEYGLKYKDE